MTAELQPPAVDARYMTGVEIHPPMDTLDAVTVEVLLGAIVNQRTTHPDLAARYRRVRDAIRAALAEYDERKGIGQKPAAGDPDAEMAAYQRDSR